MKKIVELHNIQDENGDLVAGTIGDLLGKHPDSINSKAYTVIPGNCERILCLGAETYIKKEISY